MYQEAFRHIKNLNLQTELLEALEWDQDAVDEFNMWFVNCLNASYTPDALLQNVMAVWGEDIVIIVKKIIKSEIDNIKDDKIKEARVYHED
jgi:hypothetical protein